MFIHTQTAYAEHVEVGLLSCDVSNPISFIVATKKLNCNFQPKSGLSETYTGTVSRFGVEIANGSGIQVQWKVLAPTKNIAEGSLNGEYESYSNDVAVGVGVGTNALIGGVNEVIILQPFQGQLETRFTFNLGGSKIKLSQRG